MIQVFRSYNRCVVIFYRLARKKLKELLSLFAISLEWQDNKTGKTNQCWYCFWILLFVRFCSNCMCLGGLGVSVRPADIFETISLPHQYRHWDWRPLWQRHWRHLQIVSALNLFNPVGSNRMWPFEKIGWSGTWMNYTCSKVWSNFISCTIISASSIDFSSQWPIDHFIVVKNVPSSFQVSFWLKNAFARWEREYRYYRYDLGLHNFRTSFLLIESI